MTCYLRLKHPQKKDIFHGSECSKIGIQTKGLTLRGCSPLYHSSEIFQSFFHEWFHLRHKRKNRTWLAGSEAFLPEYVSEMS